MTQPQQDCENSAHANTPTCQDEISHWTNIINDNSKDHNIDLLDKAQTKLRCYLNWCLQQKDTRNTHIQFKACCKSSQDQIDARLDKEGWGRDQLSDQQLLEKSLHYLKGK